MRTLQFIVDGQIVKQDPACDFSDLVPGSEGYLQAEFSFSPQWKNTVRAVTFYSMMGREYGAEILKDGKTCKIPAEALKKRAFKIKVTGRGRDDFKISTDKVTVVQNGGKT